MLKNKLLGCCAVFVVLVGLSMIVLYSQRRIIYVKIQPLVAKGMVYYQRYKIKTFLEQQIPQLATANAYRKAALLRNYVYRNNHVGEAAGSVLPFNKDKLLKINQGKIKLLCGGIAVEYTTLLDLYNIPNHFISIADDKAYTGKAPGDTHVFAEVIIKGKPIVMDPTFNIHWELNGKKLGIKELYTAFKQHKHPISKTDGFPLMKGRTVASYYIPYSELLTHVEVAKLATWGIYAGYFKTIDYYPDKISWLEHHRISPVFKLSSHADKSVVNLLNWRRCNDVLVALKQNKLVIITNENPLSYQLTSPVMLFKPGNYNLQLSGCVQHGGMQVSILDVTHDLFLASQIYRDFQFKHKNKLMKLNFTIKKKMPVKIVLSNYNRIDDVPISTWQLSNISFSMNSQ